MEARNLAQGWRPVQTASPAPHLPSLRYIVDMRAAMSILTRRSLIIAGVVIVLAAGVALALPLIVDVNSYRGLIQSKAEQALGRKVTLGTITLSVVPTFGIKVDNL